MAAYITHLNIRHDQQAGASLLLKTIERITYSYLPGLPCRYRATGAGAATVCFACFRHTVACGKVYRAPDEFPTLNSFK